MKYMFIEENRSEFTVKKMCQVMDVSQSGYYHWLREPISKRKTEKKNLQKIIRDLFSKHKGMAGSPIIAADLSDFPEYASFSRQRVARLMKEMGLCCKTVNKFAVITDSKHNEPVAPNLLNQNFTTTAPNQSWVTDITYLKIGKKWHYLTVFKDLFSRIVVGWDLSPSLERHSAIRALKKAIINRWPGEGLLVHSDRGIQYASSDFIYELKRNSFVQSMSRQGNCWDNAVAESFFQTIKNQLIHHYKFKTIGEAERVLFQYIEIYYNRQRKHSTNGYKSPADYETEWWEQRKVA